MESAQTVANFVRNGVGDMTYDHVRMWRDQGCVGEPELDKLKAKGVQDIEGCYADDMYNDKFLLADMMGDRVHDACEGDEEKMKEMYVVLRGIEVFKAWQDAVDMLCERWN